MIRFLFNVLFFAAFFALGSYIVLDDPMATYKQLARETKQRIDCARQNQEVCYVGPIVARQLSPSVPVYFVDPALATREGRQIAIIADDWPYCEDATGDIFLTPKYFETDFASIPSFAQFYINPQDEKIIGAAIVHDWLYALGGEPRDDAKKRADEIFRIELKAKGVNIVKRNIMYQAVSRFGGKNFGEDVEMRFRDPRNGATFTQPRPASAVIGNVGPGCETFLEEYWFNADRGPFVPSYELTPQVMPRWIEL